MKTIKNVLTVIGGSAILLYGAYVVKYYSDCREWNKKMKSVRDTMDKLYGDMTYDEIERIYKFKP